MSIASAIQTKQQQVAAAYTACNGKGATMPATQDLTNLATCIDSIQTGGGGDWTVITSNNFEFYDSDSYFTGGTVTQSDFTDTSIKLVFDNAGYLKFALFCFEDSYNSFSSILSNGEDCYVGLNVAYSDSIRIEDEITYLDMLGYTPAGDNIFYPVDIYWTAP